METDLSSEITTEALDSQQLKEFSPISRISDLGYQLRGSVQKHKPVSEHHEPLQPLCMAFINLSKVFHSVSRELLWDILCIYRCHPKYTPILKILHDHIGAIFPDIDHQREQFQVRFRV